MEKKVIRNKPSAVRDRIMAILEEKKEALAHKDFQNIFSKKWDRVTIYRALDKLVEEGKIHKVTGQEGAVQYALCSSCNSHADGTNHNHNHVHFSCIKCNKVTCIEHVTPDLELPKGFTMQEVQCMVTGICDNCPKP